MPDISIGKSGLVKFKVVEKAFHRTPREWYFFTRGAAEAWRDGELKGRGEVREIIPLDAYKLARAMEKVL